MPFTKSTLIPTQWNPVSESLQIIQMDSGNWCSKSFEIRKGEPCTVVKAISPREGQSLYQQAQKFARLSAAHSRPRTTNLRKRVR